MKKITNKTILKQVDHVYQPIEIEGTIYWIDPKLEIKEVYPQIVVEQRTLTTKDYFLMQLDTIHDIDRSCQYCIVAQSDFKIKDIPVVNLDIYVEKLSSLSKAVDCNDWENGYNSNPNQYTEQDIKKAIQLSRDHYWYEEDSIIFEYGEIEIFEQINTISLIDVDEQFNIISYE